MGPCWSTTGLALDHRREITPDAWLSCNHPNLFHHTLFQREWERNGLVYLNSRFFLRVIYCRKITMSEYTRTKLPLLPFSHSCISFKPLIGSPVTLRRKVLKKILSVFILLSSFILFFQPLKQIDGDRGGCSLWSYTSHTKHHADWRTPPVNHSIHINRGKKYTKI